LFFEIAGLKLGMPLVTISEKGYMMHGQDKSEKSRSIHLNRIDEIVFWSKKWEISPKQLLIAIQAVRSTRVIKIRAYLIHQGFAL
jgi:hypothetical protein